MATKQQEASRRHYEKLRADPEARAAFQAADRERKAKRRAEDPAYVEARRAYGKAWRNDSLPSYLVSRAKARAREAGVPCTVTPDDVIVPETCPVLGLPLIRTPGKVTDATPSLDRVTPDLGYVPGNVRVISMKANRLKQDNTIDTLERILAYIKGNAG